METLSLQSIAEYAGGRLRQGDPRRDIVGITTDSRKRCHGELFLALRGENFDGHNFIVESAANGTVGALVEFGYSSASPSPDYALIEVDDTLLAYQRIARRYRESLRAKVVAITGSNGKTSTKDFTAAVLASKYNVLKTEGNLNNHIGVPQTLLRASAATEFIVLEMGMNHPGEIAPLAAMARPDAGIITNIGTAHIEYMGSRAGIAREKGMLAEAVGPAGHVILPVTDEFSVSIAARSSAPVVMVGGCDAGIRAEDIEEDTTGSRFTLVADEMRLKASLSVPGHHMVTNALLAVATGLIYGVSPEECVAALADARLTKGRMERKSVRGIQILDDSYNANPDSMVAALETLSRIPTAGKRIAVLGKMGELGTASEDGHRRVGETAARVKVDLLISVGAEAALIATSAREAGLEQAMAVTGVDQAVGLLRTETATGDIVLVKGSRSAAMERVIARLAESPDNGAATVGTSTPPVLSHVP